MSENSIYTNFDFFVVKFCDFNANFANNILFELIFQFDNNLNNDLITNENV